MSLLHYTMEPLSATKACALASVSASKICHQLPPPKRYMPPWIGGLKNNVHVVSTIVISIVSHLAKFDLLPWRRLWCELRRLLSEPLLVLHALKVHHILPRLEHFFWGGLSSNQLLGEGRRRWGTPCLPSSPLLDIALAQTVISASQPSSSCQTLAYKLISCLNASTPCYQNASKGEIRQ